MTCLFRPLEERQANLDPGSGVSRLPCLRPLSVCGTFNAMRALIDANCLGQFSPFPIGGSCLLN